MNIEEVGAPTPEPAPKITVKLWSNIGEGLIRTFKVNVGTTAGEVIAAALNGRNVTDSDVIRVNNAEAEDDTVLVDGAIITFTPGKQSGAR